MRKKELSTDGRRKERGQSERERTDSGGKRDDSWLVNNSKKTKYCTVYIKIFCNNCQISACK